MELSKQEYWSGLSLPTPGDLPDPKIKPMSLESPALAGGFFTHWASWEDLDVYKLLNIFNVISALYVEAHSLLFSSLHLVHDEYMLVKWKKPGLLHHCKTYYKRVRSGREKMRYDYFISQCLSPVPWPQKASKNFEGRAVNRGGKLKDSKQNQREIKV